MNSLDQIIDDSNEAREVKRALAVKMQQNGIARTQIAALLNVSEQFVSKWKMRFEQFGGAALRLAYTGSRSFLNDEQRSAVVGWISEQETLSIERLAEYLETRYAVQYQSKQSLYELLSEGGMSWHKSEKRNPKRDAEQVAERRGELKKKLLDSRSEIESGEIVVLLQDECHLLWGDCLGYVWGKRGEAIEVLVTNERTRETFFGAVNLLTEEFHLQAKPKADGANTVEYVKWLQAQYPGKRLWLLWDGASFHRYGEMRLYLAEQNQGLSEAQWQITCLWFAPNASDQNPVEDIWLSGKQAIRQCFNPLLSGIEIVG